MIGGAIFLFIWTTLLFILYCKTVVKLYNLLPDIKDNFIKGMGWFVIILGAGIFGMSYYVIGLLHYHGS